MDPDDARGPYTPPEPAQDPQKSGAQIATVVAGTVLVTLLGAAAAVMMILRAWDRGPPVTYSELWLDNRLPDRLSVEIDGKVEATLEPHGTDGAVGVLRVPDGHRALRFLDASGAIKGSQALDFAGVRLMYPVGGEAHYALVTVHYARPETRVVADSARPLPSNPGEPASRMPLSVAVDRGIDEPFPERSREPVRRHLCRVVAGQAQCEGGPQALTSQEPFTGLQGEE